MANLENKVAVITGRNSGIGYATAKKLSKDGVQVIITGRRKEAIEKAASALNVTGILALELAPRKIRVNAVSPGCHRDYGQNRLRPCYGSPNDT